MADSANRNQIEIGDRFRSTYADSNALWEVTRKLSSDSWEAEIVDEPVEINGQTFPGDYAGQKDAFLTDHILRAKVYEREIEKSREAAQSFADSLVHGQVIHYYDSFSRYVRGTVQRGLDGVKFLPTALVGDWSDHELPHYNPVGDIYAPYYAQKILDGETTDIGHASNYFESDEFSTPRGKAGSFDPRFAPEITLIPPTPTPEEMQRFALEQIRQGAIQLLTDTEDPGEAMAAANCLYFQVGKPGREL